jgi:HTH-type transcriptional regulator/antitoxin HigA
MITKRIRPIKTEADYEEALELIEELIDANPAVNTPESEQLEILSSLIERYEQNKYQIDAPSAIEAIKFVMEQRNLDPKDLIPFIGSKSRVSEVLSGKRNLSIEMIRSLESGLGIPSKVLIKKTETLNDQLYGTWNIKVFDEMKKRGYFNGLNEDLANKSNLLKEFFESINRKATVQALLRKASYRTSTTDHNALAAWSGFVIKKADRISFPDHINGSVDEEFMRNLAKLSADKYGPLKAVDELLTVGIKLVIEPAFPKTYIDGATIFTEDHPIIGLTLRQDRLDNFWFTLMHEIAHVVLHSENDKIDVFYDEIYESDDSFMSDQEAEADTLAAESLVPASAWEASPAHLVPSEITFELLAQNLGIHPSIIAGKYRHQSKAWKLFSDIVVENKVKHLFEEAAKK